MKFSCDRCQTRYSIGDDKVRGKVLKIRCKTCGNIIVVREQTTASAVAVPAAAAGGTSPSQPAMQSPATSSGTFSAPQPPKQPKQPATPRAPAAKDVEWFVAIKGKQHGPAKKDDVMRLFKEGRITERTYLWNETMPQWTRLKEVPEFAALISASPEVVKRAPPPPPPDEGQQQGAEIIPLDEARRAREMQNGVSSVTNDPFAAVAAQSGSVDGGAPRDSTRVFIMQAGLHNRQQKHKVYASVAVLVFLLVAGVGVLDYQGYVEIPGLHSAIEIVTSPKEERGQQPFEGAAWETGEEDPKLKCKLNPNPEECVRQVMASNKAKRAKRKQLGGTGVSDINLDGAFNTGPNETAPLVAGNGGPGFAGGGGVGLSADEIKKQLEGPRGGPATPTIRQAATPAISGGPELEAETVAKVVKENYGSIQGCVEQNAKSGNLPRGKQRLILTVMGNGLVARATFADAAVAASPVGECITKAARRWKFPAFLGEPTDVEAPLILSIGG